jgi:hypothetical protein
MVSSRRGILSVLFLTLAAAGCAHGSAAPPRPGIAIQRGGAWSTLSVALPHVTGPNVNLTFDNGELRGFVGAGALSVKVSGDKADGYGPSGPVAMTMEREGPALRIDGEWNGGPVHLQLGPDGLRGSVIRRGSRTTTATASCSYDLRGGSPKGGLVGTSTCIGMPQQTRLEIDPGVRQQLSPPELSVLLVAVLASPPLDLPAERI